jgi:signal transduction histidine kinase
MELVPLHAFMTRHRDEIMRLVTRELLSSAPDSDPDDLGHGVSKLFDEMIGALQHEAGLPVSSPLPGASTTAMWLGGRRQARGYAISRIAEDLGTISNVVGELARRERVSFAGSDYQVFNQCIDSASAQALEQYSNQELEQREHNEAERLGVVVHELRNTLAGARLAYSVLRQGEVGIRSKTGDVLDRSHERLEKLIGEMVLAVQLGAGVKPKLRRRSVASLLGNAMDVVVPERRIRLKADVDDALLVDADESLLISALSNLVQNAFKFTREGGCIILRAFEQGSAVVIEVEDECGGLPPGKSEALFAPFVSNDADHRGLGLGLTICRDAVEAHGGQVTVTNLPGKGCIFRVTIPSSSDGKDATADRRQ